MPFLPASDALKRFKVLDLTRVRAGPTAARQLADWGADVIKIEERPEGGGEGMGGPRDGPDFLNLHRNKRSLTLDLKTPEGVALLKRLAASADVLIENYRPDVKKRLGIDYATLKPINPRLVYCSISGFGQTGPYATRPGFDQVAQGMGGLMSITGLPGQGPVRAGIPLADLTSGLFAAMGVLVALHAREVTGEGQEVQTSLLQAQIFMLDFQGARWLVSGEVPGQAGNDHPTSIPTGVFPTTDGHVNIAAAGQHIWERLARMLGKPEWIDDPDFKTGALRSKNRKRLNALIEECTARLTTDQLIDQLAEAGVPAGPIYRIDQMFADPQVRHLGVTRPTEGLDGRPIELLAQPVTLGATPSTIVRRPPKAGEQTDEVLGELGLSAGEIAELRTKGVV
jgi:formyl-CoA transferase